MTKGSHRVATRLVEGIKFTVTFVEPHGKRKTIHKQAVLDLLKQLDEVTELEEGEDND